MPEKVKLDFTDISRRIKQVDLPEVDLVVCIATGGTVPASLAAYQLDKALVMLHINYRAEDNVPQHETPILLSDQYIPHEHCRILLVDDVSVTGQTLNLAKKLLNGHDVFTFVLKGQGDYVAFPEIASCVQWPWQVPVTT